MIRKNTMLRKFNILVLSMTITASFFMSACSINDPLNAKAKPVSKSEEKKDASKANQEIQEQYTLPADPADPANKQIDWAGLQQQNPDIYAWIYIPNTTVNYPILQAQNQSEDYYYLRRDPNKNPDDYGSIFSEPDNTTTFTDPFTVLYGHTSFADYTPDNLMMFSDLHKYEQNQFLKDNPFIYIYTPNKVFKYQIFCVNTFDDRYLLSYYDFQNPSELDRYLSDLRSSEKRVEDPSVPTPDDGQYLTLSTCVSLDGPSRFLVTGVLKETFDKIN